ncbi:MAG: hypothetical protein DA408_08600 [Bacteroidetes bacterium]|nr:MAG: hypothetical protein C7N36_00155 [Bacteroidota bacterium]PTM12905.1 MAG: hypothetical protein DA408_08600 [Bacteroidota bacterium]
MKSLQQGKSKKYPDKHYETRKAAFREAKRDNGIPVSQQPIDVIRPNDKDKWDEYGLDRSKNRALYRFVVFLLGLFGFSEEREIHIREDSDYSYGAVDGRGDQREHFNSGEVQEDNTRLRRHHYFNRRRRK